MEMRPIGSSTSTVFKRLFEACSDAPDMEHAMVDATIVKVIATDRAQKGGKPTKALPPPSTAAVINFR
jgi:hypothetical protein